LLIFSYFQTAYNSRDDVYKFLRQVFVLPFLPADHMPVAFNTLKEKATTQQLQSVTNYIQGTWFDSTVWPVTA
jgi:hypothetical protein